MDRPFDASDEGERFRHVATGRDGTLELLSTGHAGLLWMETVQRSGWRFLYVEPDDVEARRPWPRVDGS